MYLKGKENINEKGVKVMKLTTKTKKQSKMGVSVSVLVPAKN